MRLTPGTTIVLVLSSMIGLIGFGWPLVVDADASIGHEQDAPLLFAITLLMVVLVLLAEIARGGIDAKALAMLGVLAAVGAALRPLGGGVTGFQPMFIVMIIGGRVFGPGFGFVLGLLAMLGAALVTGGVGPWLPFQMLGAAWMGLGAGLLPRAEGRREIALLAGYGALTSVLYGFMLNMWFWPFAAGLESGVSFVAGDPVLENLHRFLVFSLLTSLGFDLVRALGIAVLVVLAGGPMLRALRRASRRAAFSARPEFASARGGSPSRGSSPKRTKDPT